MLKIIWLSIVIFKLIIFLLLLIKIYVSRKIIESAKYSNILYNSFTIKLAVFIQNNYIKKAIFKALFYSD